MASILTIAIPLTIALLIYWHFANERARDAAVLIASSERSGYYLDLCQTHGLKLDIADLPDKDGDESFRTFTFSRAGVTRTLRPQATLEVLQTLEAGDTDQAFTILKMAQP